MIRRLGAGSRLLMHQLAQVELTPQPLDRYQELLGPVFDPVGLVAEKARRSLAGRTIWNVNSTARGGGVAEMLHAYLPYVLDAGVDTRWLVIQPDDPDFFVVTKRMHNRFHGNPGDGGDLGKPELDLYRAALAELSRRLADQVASDDVVILHDPQTAGLIPALKSKGAIVVWRCHIGIDDANEIATDTQDFLFEFVGQADRCIFSRREYVWPQIPYDRVAVISPGIDAFTPKNELIDEATVAAVLGQIGLTEPSPPSPPSIPGTRGVGYVRRRASIIQDAHLPAGAPLIAQISRWDRLKDHSGLLTLFVNEMTDDRAHLALVGPESSGVDDDPEGAAVYAELEEEWRTLTGPFRSRIHLVGLPMDDLDENGYMVNAIQRRADVIVQKSLAEGFGLTVSEGMWKSRPVVASRLGGIQDQIEDGQTGILIDDATDLPAFAEALDRVLADRDQARRIGEAARRSVMSGALSVQRLVSHFELLEDLGTTDGRASGV